jgi:hypothetical protein
VEKKKLQQHWSWAVALARRDSDDRRNAAVRKFTSICKKTGGGNAGKPPSGKVLEFPWPKVNCFVIIRGQRGKIQNIICLCSPSILKFENGFWITFSSFVSK